MRARVILRNFRTNCWYSFDVGIMHIFVVVVVVVIINFRINYILINFGRHVIVVQVCCLKNMSNI